MALPTAQAAIATPAPNATMTMALEPGQYHQFAFTIAQVDAIAAQADGSLEIRMKDGGVIIITNFDELANSAQSCGKDTIFQLLDDVQGGDILGKYSIINFTADDFGMQANADGVTTINRPHENSTREITLAEGEKYAINFDWHEAAKTTDGKNLILSFADGAVLVLRNFDQAMGGDLPAAMTLSDGTVITLADLSASNCVLDPDALIAARGRKESVADIEPAAGEAKAPSDAKLDAVEPAAGDDMAQAAQNVADIEPAAGQTGNVGGSGGGFGFQSTVDSANLNGLNPIGPIGPTELAFGFPGLPPVETLALTPPPAIPLTLNALPIANPDLIILDETNLGPITLNGAVTADFGTDGPGTFTTNNTFFASGSMTAGILSSNGVGVVVTQVGNVYTGTAGVGGPTVFTLTLNPNGTYAFVLLDNLDHADGSNPNDVINLQFGVTATDGDGDSVATTITVVVEDDAPVAVDDSQSIAAGATTATGNVRFNDTQGQDDPATVTFVTFGATTVAVPAVGTTMIAGTYGTLEIAADGSYTYTKTAIGGGFSDVFTYTLRDFDGDTDTAVLVIDMADGTPVIGDTGGTAPEAMLSGGPVALIGLYTSTYGADGPGAITLQSGPGSFTSGGSQLGGTLSSNGVGVVVTQAGLTYTGTAGVGGPTVFTLTIDTVGNWTFTLFQNLDHADGSNSADEILLNFGIQITDADGDTDTGNIAISVRDTGPVAVNDTLGVTGNVMTNDTAGQDDPARVSAITFGVTTVPVPNGGSATIAGANGTLVINSDGTYTYTPTVPGLDDTFTYTIIDFDGDTSSANLTITSDGVPVIGDGSVVVDETFLAPSISGGGNVTFNYGGDGQGAGGIAVAYTGPAITSNGTAVVITQTAPGTFEGRAGVGGPVVFTFSLNLTTGAYTYTQFTNLDHPNAADPNDAINLTFGLTITDADGDTDTGTITVVARDDGPVAVADTFSSSTGTVSGNVLANDSAGQDDPGRVSSFTFGATTVSVPNGGSNTVTNASGTLVVNSDGTFTYTPSTPGTSATFTYIMVDRDNDPSSPTMVTLDTDGTPVINNGAASVNENGGFDTVNGTYTFNYGGDGAGQITGGAYTGPALTSGGVAVVVSYNAGTKTWTGMAGVTPVFTLQLTTDGNFTFTQLAKLDHPSGGGANSVVLTFATQIIDSDTDTDPGQISITVIDDVPVAANDSNTGVVGSTVLSGNVLTNDTPGADAPIVVNNPGVYVLTRGTLTINANGTYTYNITSPGGVDTFNVQIRDTDGDIATSVLTLTTVPNPPGVDLTVNNNVNDIWIYEDGNGAPASIPGVNNGPAVVPIVANIVGGNGNDVLTVTISGLLAGWTIGAPGWTNTGPGTWAITLAPGQNFNGSVTLTPPANRDGDMPNITVTASVFDPDSGTTPTASDQFNVFVDAVADPGQLTLPGNITHQIALTGMFVPINGIVGAVTDTDGSETIVRYIIDLGASAAFAADNIVLNRGVQTAPGVWELTHAEITAPGLGFNLNVVTLQDLSDTVGTHTITVTLVTQETNLSGLELTTVNNTATVAGSFTVTIPVSPLVLDLDGDGIELVNVQDGVLFDMTNDGILDRTGWAGADDGLLVFDENGNGVVDNGSELFGSTFIDGFTELSAHDGNGDGVIDMSDAVWANLQVWRDANQDGVSQADELFGLDHFGIIGINLNAIETDDVINGNTVPLISVFMYANGSMGTIVDAFFGIEAGRSDAQSVIDTEDDLTAAINEFVASGVSNDNAPVVEQSTQPVDPYGAPINPLDDQQQAA